MDLYTLTMKYKCQHLVTLFHEFFYNYSSLINFRYVIINPKEIWIRKIFTFQKKKWKIFNNAHVEKQNSFLSLYRGDTYIGIVQKYEKGRHRIPLTSHVSKPSSPSSYLYLNQVPSQPITDPTIHLSLFLSIFSHVSKLSLISSTS